jgi:hypothetical protein
MKEAVDETASILKQLEESVRKLEIRISALEGQSQPQSPGKLTIAHQPIEREQPRSPAIEFPCPDTPAAAVSVFGKAVLVIAGAYLLRAVAESGSVPQLPVIIVAILYAWLWMIWAARVHASSRFASVTYGITSVVILSPLLWESTVRFRILSPVSSAVVLVAFVVLALALAWRNDLEAILWMAFLGTAVTAFALIIATHELVPLTTAIFAVALLSESVACLKQQVSGRAVPAIAADLALLLFVDVMTSSGGVPQGYQPAPSGFIAGLCLALLATYGGSIAIRTFVFSKTIAFLEIAQGSLAFVLAVFGAGRATRGSADPAFGASFLILAGVCYWAALSRFGAAPHTRNRRVFGIWAAALLLAGSRLLLPANLQVPFLCVAGILAAFLYARTEKMSLRLHMPLFLATATVLSGLTSYVAGALAKTVPAAADGRVLIVAVSAALCYLIAAHKPQNKVSHRVLAVFPALLAAVAVAAIAVSIIVWFATGRLELVASRLSVVRTIVNCALALTFGVAGYRWKRVELGWVAYTAVAFGTLKLLFEDLRIGNAASLVVSLLFYGLVLILLPRLTRQTVTES